MGLGLPFLFWACSNMSSRCTMKENSPPAASRSLCIWKRNYSVLNSILSGIWTYYMASEINPAAYFLVPWKTTDLLNCHKFIQPRLCGIAHWCKHIIELDLWEVRGAMLVFLLPVGHRQLPSVCFHCHYQQCISSLLLSLLFLSI